MIGMSSLTKKCNKCDRIFTIDCFYYAEENRDKHSCVCKYCMTAYSKLYRETHSDDCKKYDHNHYLAVGEIIRIKRREKYKNNAEQAREDRKKYYKDNKDKCLISSTKWKNDNKKRLLEYQREYRMFNPQPHRDAAKRRKILQRGVTVEKFSSVKIYERDGWICQICKKQVNRKLKYPHPLSPSIDHILPLANGGTHERKNVQLAHLHCNVSLGTGGIKQLRLIA